MGKRGLQRWMTLQEVCQSFRVQRWCVWRWGKEEGVPVIWSPGRGRGARGRERLVHVPSILHMFRRRTDRRKPRRKVYLTPEKAARILEATPIHAAALMCFGEIPRKPGKELLADEAEVWRYAKR